MNTSLKKEYQNDGLFRQLSETEELDFRASAWEQHNPGQAINSVWHPVYRDECHTINNGQLMHQACSLLDDAQAKLEQLIEMLDQDDESGYFDTVATMQDNHDHIEAIKDYIKSEPLHDAFKVKFAPRYMKFSNDNVTS